MKYTSGEDLWFGPLQGFNYLTLKKIKGIRQARDLMDRYNIEATDQAIRSAFKNHVRRTLK